MLVLVPGRAPTGTITMLFTDIEGSTRAARALGDRWAGVLARHHAILRSSIEGAGGYVEGTEGDAFVVAFHDADGAVRAARDAQAALRAEDWPDLIGEVRVRMGVHTAVVDRANGQYVGLEIHRAARVAAAAHGGQVILTAAAVSAAREGGAYRDLGTHRLKDFPEPTHLFQLVDEQAPAREFPPPRTLDIRPTNLPATDITVIGRDDEIGQARDAFAAGARVVTLTGLGGAGKTTAALAIARSLIDEYPAGVWLVRAEELHGGDELVRALAGVLWVRDTPGVDLVAAIAEHLDGRAALFVLDNLEQVAAAADRISDVVGRAEGSQVLATSRGPLHVTGERAIPLGPLSLDAASELLERRVTLAGGSIDSSRERDAVLALCDRLGRLPLAIELVAPQLRLFTPQELLNRLGSVVDIGSPDQGRPERHRSVRAAVEWSVGLLAGDGRALFRRLAVFRGPAPVELVEEVCGREIDTVGALFALLDHSLVQRAPGGCVLATAVREVAAAHLAEAGEEDDIRRAHAEAILDLATRMGAAFADPEDGKAIERLCDDAWAAVDWARGKDRDIHRGLVYELGGGWALSGQLRRALEEMELALAAPLPAHDRGALLTVAAYIWAVAGRPEPAQGYGEEAVRLLEDGPADLVGHAHVRLAQAYNVAGRDHEAVVAARRAVACFRSTGERHLVVRGLVELAQTELVVGEIAKAKEVLDEAERVGGSDDRRAAAMVNAQRADLALAEGDLGGALLRNAEALDGGYAAWSVAGICVALSLAEQDGEALEAGAIAEAMARDLGTSADVLTQAGPTLREAVAVSRGRLPAEVADAAERAGRELPAGQRLLRARHLALTHAGRLSVSHGGDSRAGRP